MDSCIDLTIDDNDSSPNSKRIKLKGDQLVPDWNLQLKTLLISDSLTHLEGESSKLIIVLYQESSLIQEDVLKFEKFIPTKILAIMHDQAIHLRTYFNWTELKNTEKVLFMTYKTFSMTLYHGLLKLSEIFLILYDAALSNEKETLLKVLADFSQHPYPYILSIPSKQALGCITSNENVKSELSAEISEAVRKNKPDLLYISFKSSKFPLNNKLLDQLFGIYYNSSDFNERKEHLYMIHGSLGMWAKDFFTIMAIEKLVKSTSTTQNVNVSCQLNELSEAWNNNKEQIALTRNVLIDPFGSIISPKLKSLFLHIVRQNTNSPPPRLIICVRDSSCAFLLYQIISKLFADRSWIIQYIHKSAGSVSEIIPKLEDSVYNSVVSAFRKGRINILVITFDSYINLGFGYYNVIWFDCFSPLVSLIANKKFFFKEGLCHKILFNLSGPKEVKFINNIQKLDDFYSVLDKITFLTKDKNQIKDPLHVFEVKETGAKISLNYAKDLIFQYCQALPSDDDFKSVPEYQIVFEPPNFKCILVLPDHSPIDIVEGDIFLSKVEAKQHTAWQACIKLYEANAFDKSLIPLIDTNFTKIPDKISCNFKCNDLKTMCYVSSKKPDLWEITDNCMPQKIFINFIAFNSLNHRPFAIATRSKFPSIIPITLKIKNEFVNAKIYPAPGPTELELLEFEAISNFTLQLFNMALKKTMYCSSLEMSYFFVPLKLKFKATEVSKDLIDWEVINFQTEESSKDWIGKIVQDSKSQELFSVIEDLSPNILPKEGNVKMVPLNLDLDCIGLTNYNSLAQNTAAPVSGKKELLGIVNVPMDVLCSAFIFPPLMARIDSLLLAKELQLNLRLSMIKDVYLVEALTLKSANLPIDNKRLEFLGDSFLNFIVKTFHIVESSENSFAPKKAFDGLLASNKYLILRCIELGIHNYLCVDKFSYNIWTPCSFTYLLPNEKPIEKVRKKAFADIMESILGAAILSGGEIAGLQCMVAIGIWPTVLPSWDGFELLSRNKRFNLPLSISESLHFSLLESIIGYNFKNNSVLFTAIIEIGLATKDLKNYCWTNLGLEVERFFFTKWVVLHYPHMTNFFYHHFRDKMNKFNSLMCFEKSLLQEFIDPTFKNIQQLLTGPLDVPTSIFNLFSGLDLAYISEMKNSVNLSNNFVKIILGAIFFDSGLYFSTVSQFVDVFVYPVYKAEAFNFKYIIKQPFVFIQRALYLSQCGGFSISSQMNSPIGSIESFVYLHSIPITSSTGPTSQKSYDAVFEKFLDILNSNPSLIQSHCICKNNTIAFEPTKQDAVVLLD